MDRVVYHTLEHAPDRAMAEPDLERVVSWAHRARIMSVALNMVLAGRVYLTVVDGRVLLNLTPTGG